MISADPGSFRDPSSRIVTEGDRVIRLLDERGRAAWNSLASSPFHSKAVSDGRLVESAPLDDVPYGAVGALEHPRLPMITYPYEWTFSMLKEAALLQLSLIEDSLADGLIIKDATPFNIQFVGGRPVFIDIGSFEPYRTGEPWIGYRQFTRQFLFPLMMRAWAGIPFQPWLRGNPEGPTAAEMRSLLPLRRRMSVAGFMHVSLQARLESRVSGLPVRDDLGKAGFKADLIVANVRKLRELVASLQWESGHTNWTDYHSCTHVGRDRETKAGFLEHTMERTTYRRVLDLGANDAYFSSIAAESGALAIAVDGDEGTLDAVHKTHPGTNMSLVLSDLANPSPSQGWAGIERPSLQERAKPDLVIAYGLVHHLIYTSSIPPASVLDWLRGFDADVLLEFVAPEDEMVRVLTANKRSVELHHGRSEEEFRSLLHQRFIVRSELALGGGLRILFDLAPA